jgi:hypothetical protein
MGEDAATSAIADRATPLLLAPFAGWLAACAGAVPTRAALNDLRERVAPTACSGSGRPIRFVPPPPACVSYEQYIFATGEVPTRAEDWHDIFNALAWCAWPLAKAACNALHRAAMVEAGDGGPVFRCACRDALTHFDECGVLVISTDPELLRLLADQQWEAAFWERRTAVIAKSRFLVFGHATRDQLRRPFVGLCGKALYRQVPPEWLRMAPAERQADADRWLAGWLAAQGTGLTTRAFSPLPLMGIPGITPDNAVRDYYRDARQFRPKRRREEAMPACAGFVCTANASAHAQAITPPRDSAGGVRRVRPA